MRPFEALLSQWEGVVLKDTDLSVVFPGSDQRHSLVKRAVANGSLIPLKRELYVIGAPYRRELPDLHKLAYFLHGPSFLSFESALSVWGWIPEAVHSVTCTSSKKSKVYETKIGRFEFFKIPTKFFYLETLRKENCIVASPWRAIGDILYFRRKNWKHVEDISEDLRVEFSELENIDTESLEQLSSSYPSLRVRKILASILESLYGHETYRKSLKGLSPTIKARRIE